MAKGKARCKTGHLYRVWYFTADEGGGDRSEHMRLKACNMSDAMGYVAKSQFKDEVQKELNFEGDNKFGIVDLYKPSEEQGEDDFIDMGRTIGFQIEEDDDIDPEFKTIFGSNDFVDITGKKPKKAEPWNPTMYAIAQSGNNEALGRELTKDAQKYQRELKRGK